ncbi:MAG: immunoglobulin domain-containing protein [Phycisphaerales bacterium]|nr:immunoglobulin domain-containing protein [Phycisphaerales bacterium]
MMMRNLPSVLLLPRVRSTVAALALPLTFALAAPAHAQCAAAWVPGIGTPGTTAQVNAIDVLPGGDVVVGGYGGFPVPGGTASYIGRYSFASGTWSRVGTSGPSPGLAVFSLTALPSGDLIVGGEFPPCFSKCELSTTGRWTSGGTGMSNWVLASALLPSGDLVAGGTFTTGGNVTLNCIGRLTFGGWRALQSGDPSTIGTNNSVLALAVLPDGDLLAGGLFTSAGGVSGRNYVARVNPVSGIWTGLGVGTGGTVRALALLPDGTAIVGGDFTSAGGVPGRNYIARVNPTTGAWSSVGAGTNGPVNALAVLLDGTVIVGGSFTSAGGVSGRNNIARYTPGINAWSSLGGAGFGVNNTVRALKVLPGGDVIVGGDFTTADGQPANRLARYSPGGNAPSITVQPQPAAVSPAGTAIFSITANAGAAGTGGIPSFQWRKDGVAINTATNPSAATATLTITNVQVADLGTYDCRVTGSCGSTTSTAATLTFTPVDRCSPADIADDTGQSLPPFGVGGIPPFVNNGVTEGDYNLFFSIFFNGCSF